MVEYHPISARDQSRTCKFLGCELVTGRIRKGDTSTADLEDLEGWMHQIFILEESMRKKY